MNARAAAADPNARARWTLAAAPLCIAILGPLLPLLIVLADVVPPSAPVVDRSLAVVIAVVVALGILTSLVALVANRPRRFPTALWWPLAAFFASQLLALALAVHPQAGVFSVACTFGGMVVFVAAVESLALPAMRHAFLGCYLASATLAALFAAALAIMRVPPAMFVYEHGRASGTFLQPNEFAGYLLFVIPVGLAQLAAPRWLRALGLAAAAAGIAGLALSVSRAAIASLAIGLVVLLRRFDRRALAAYALAAALLLLAMLTVFRNVAHDPSENASRIAVWGSSLRLVQRFALTGVGPLGFHLAYPAFKLPEATVDEVHAHDVPLHVLIEDGVAGLACLIWFVAAAVRQARRAGAAIPRADRERVLLYAALSAGFAASALQNLVDVVTTFLLIVAWPMLGLVLSLGSAAEAPP